MRGNRLLLWLALGAAAPTAAAQQAYLIRGARVVTVSGPVIENGSVLVQAGRIQEVGAEVAAPPGARVIDAHGLSVYPGLFDANSLLGMAAARETTMGDMTPELQAFASFHMEDGAVEMARANGVTEVLARTWQRGGAGGRVRPRAILTGQAAVMSLAGATPDARAIMRDAGVLLNFPSVGVLEYTDDERFAVVPWSATKKRLDKALSELGRFFADARAYMSRADSLTPEERGRTLPDLRLEAMLPVLRRERPLLIDVDNHVDIEAAVEFARRERVTPILMGAQEAWKLADYLKQNDVGVILAATHTVPEAEDDPVDIQHRTPAILHQKGVRFAIGSFGSAGLDSRHLPYQAGTAVGYGLPYDAALRSVTLAPAELLGVAGELGSIDPGKRAHLVVADGDILEVTTRIRYVFVDGRPVSLETEHDRSYETYRNRK